MRDVGLIGFGNFGKIVYSILKNEFNIFVYDKNIEVAKGVNYSGLKECAEKEIIILAVPVQDIEEVLHEIKDFIKNGALIFDVSSVKIKPIDLMLKILPEYCQIIATHPLFGPSSIKKEDRELKIVLCPVRTKILEKITGFLAEKLKFQVIIKSAEEHDREMAMVQALSHFLAKALNEINIKSSDLSTLSYNHLLKMKEILENDTKALFETIENENPFAAEYREKLIDKLIEIHEELEK
jgi:prephenate dehydrogenase